MLGLQVASSPSPDVATGRSTRALWFMQGGALAALLLMAVVARDAAAKPAVDSAAPLAKPSVDSAAPLAKPSVDSAAPPTQPAHNLAGAVALYNEGPLFAPSLPVAQPVSAERAQWAISARKQRQQVLAPSMTQAHTVAAAAEQVSRRAALAAAAGVAASAVAATQPASAATPQNSASASAATRLFAATQPASQSVAPVLKEKLLVVYGADGTMNPADVNKIAREKLTDAQKKISLLAEDEEPYTGQTTNGYTWENKVQGTYVGAISGTPLFESDAQFDAGNGLPSFSTAFASSVIERPMPQDLYQQRMAKRTGAENVLTGKFARKQVRTEVIDATSGAHLGYLFAADIRQPTSTGKRYTINAGALTFVPAKKDAVVV